MDLNQDFSSFFNSNSPGAAQAPASPAVAAPTSSTPSAAAGLSQDFSSVFAQPQQRPTTNAANTAKLDDVLAAEGATALKPLVSAFYGQETSSGSNTSTSVDNAIGPMQILQSTGAPYMKPGENLQTNGLAIGTRILADYAKRYNNDPAKIAVAYFSGPGNVADSGPTPWKRNVADGNGTTVAQYVAGIQGRLGGSPAVLQQQPAQPEAPAALDLSQAPKWSAVVADPRFQKLSPQEQQQASDAYFQKWIAPSVSPDQIAETQQIWQQRSADAIKAVQPSTWQAIKNGVSNAATGALNVLTSGAQAQDGISPDGVVQPALAAQSAQSAGVLGNGKNLPAPQGNTPEQTAALNGAMMASPAFRNQVYQQFDAATPAQRAQMMQQPGLAGQLAQQRAAQQANAPGIIPTLAEDRATQLIGQGVAPDVATQMAQHDAATGTPTQAPNSMQATNFDFDAAQRYRNANPFVRGAVKGAFGAGQAIVGIGQWENDMASSMFGTQSGDPIAAGLKSAAGALQSKSDAIGESPDMMTRNLESATSGLVQLAPAMLGGAFVEGMQALPLAQNFLQMFGQSYSEGRAAGQDITQASTRAGMMGAFAVLGHALGLDSKLDAIRQSVAGASSDVLGQSIWNSLIRDLPSTQVMALGNFVTDKLPGGIGLTPEAKFTDWLQQAGDMFVQTAMMNGMLGAGAAVGAGLARRAGASGTSANAPHASQMAADDVVRQMAAQHGLDASAIIPEPTPVPQPSAAPLEPVAPGAPAAEPPPTTAAQPLPVSPSEAPAAAPTPAAEQRAPTAGAVDPQQVLEFAQQRYDALLAKQRGTLEPTMSPTGHEDVEVPGQQLTPTEQMEWDALRSHRNDPAAIAHFYGFDGTDVEPNAPTADEINAAAHEAATSPNNDLPEPTQAQKEAGNYQKGHVEIHGLDVTIENPQGSERSGTSPDGVIWKNTLQDHYGYIRRTVGADEEHIDTFIGPNPASRHVFIVDQRDPDSGKFDEHKVMLGYDSMPDADAAYHRNYENGWNGRAAISELPIAMFKEWLAKGDTRAPFARAVSASMRSAGEKPKTEKEARALRAAEQATPPVADGMVRMYHGGEPKPDYSGPLWFSSSEQYARDWGARDGRTARTWYVDVPADHPVLASEYPEQHASRGYTTNRELPAELASQRKPLDAAPIAPPKTEREARARKEKANVSSTEAQDGAGARQAQEGPAPGPVAGAQDAAPAAERGARSTDGSPAPDGSSAGRPERAAAGAGRRVQPESDGPGRDAVAGNVKAAPLDHGELNVPLAKRGDIDAQIDRFKAEQAKVEKTERKTQSAQFRTDKARAKELFAEVGDALIAQHGEKFGSKDLRATLDSMVKWEPKKFIALAEKFKTEQRPPEATSEQDAATAAHGALSDMARDASTQREKRLHRELGDDVTKAFEGDADALARVEKASRSIKYDSIKPQLDRVIEEGNAKRPSEPVRDVNGNVEQRQKLTGSDRFEGSPAREGEPKEQVDARRAVLDYMNGDATRTDVMRALNDSKLPEGVKFSITQRMGDDGPSMGEIHAMETGTWAPAKIGDDALAEHHSLAEHNDHPRLDPAFERMAPLAGAPEADRTSALMTLRRLSARLDKGDITDAEFRLGVQNLLGKLETKRDGQKDRAATRERERGDLYVRERLLRAVRQGDIEHSTAAFAQWLLDKNPALADDLGISVRTAGADNRGSAGLYNSISRVVTLFRGNANVGTAVHEILHHTERMMPEDVRAGIYKAWAREWQQAYRGATPEQKPIFNDMLGAALGDRRSWERVAEAFADGTLDYNDHYKLLNPSEYWAVKGTDLLKARYDARDSWIGRAKQWLSDMVERVKSIFGKDSNTPVIDGMRDVLNGEGTFRTPAMMTERTPDGVRDLSERPGETPDQAALLSTFRDLAKSPTERADDSFERTRNIIDKSFDTKSTAKTFNWFEKTFASQVHKAIKDPDFGRVFNSMRRMMNHTGLAATRPAEHAPMILPKSDNFRQSVKTLFAGKRVSEDIKGATRALLDGTLAGDNVMKGRTWSDKELRANYKLSDKGIEAYKQARQAVDSSLDEVAAAEAWGMVHGLAPDEMRSRIVDDPTKAQGLLRGVIDGKLEMLTKAHDRAVKAGDTQKAEILHSLMMPYVETRKKVDDIFDKAEMLKTAGYLPLMRFGKYTVYAHKIDPDTGTSARDAETGQPLVHYFGMFPTEAEAKHEHEKQLALYRDDPTVQISRGVKSEKAHQLYEGLSPETLSLFADKVGSDAAMQHVIQLALSERSALKRRLERRAITGFSEDLPRILSNFLTSNGRFAAQRLYMRDVNRAIQEIPKEKGDVADEAIKLKQFVLNGDDPGSRTMAGMFLWTMAGSPVSAAVVASEPFQKIFPYLSQFGVGRATAGLGRALTYVLGRRQITDPQLRAAMQRAAREGIIKPQEIFHLYDLGMSNMSTWLSSQLAAHSGPGSAVTRGVADGIRSRATALSTMLGIMHSAAETFGRKMAFHAAWEVAKARGEKDPYAWTVRAIDEAGSQFGKINRSNIERTYAGRMMLAYKQFTIGWLGLLFRMARKGGVEGARGAAVMLATQMAMGGLQGLPFMQNLDDLVDTVGNFMGHNTDFARIKRQWAEKSFGHVFSEAMMHGLARFLPVDLSEHFGMGDIIPGTDLLKAENAKDKARHVLNVLGPQMQLVTRLMDAYDAAASGNWAKAGIAVAPNFIKRPAQGAMMLDKGASTDMQGRKVAPATPYDAVAKIVGGATAQTNEQAELRGEVNQAVATVRDKQAQILNQWARGIADNNVDAVRQARATLSDWNAKNPDSRIVITASALIQQIKQMRLDANTRAILSAPKGLKADVVSTLRGNNEE